MPELPEAVTIAAQMDRSLAGRRISAVEVFQPKCLNLPAEALSDGLTGKTLGSTQASGKWIVTGVGGSEDVSGQLAFNLGMGGEILLVQSGSRPPDKWAVRLWLAGDDLVNVSFWWFGHVHLLDGTGNDSRGPHPITTLGPCPLSLGRDGLRQVLRRYPESGVKSCLLNQRKMAGIGNVYVQDPLWLAGIHPLRRIASLSDAEIDALADSLQLVLSEAVELGGSDRELGLDGRPGRHGVEHFRVAYKPGAECPRCGATITKIKTGPTSSYICPGCQAER